MTILRDLWLLINNRATKCSSAWIKYTYLDEYYESIRRCSVQVSQRFHWLGIGIVHPNFVHISVPVARLFKIQYQPRHLDRYPTVSRTWRITRNQFGAFYAEHCYLPLRFGRRCWLDLLRPTVQTNEPLVQTNIFTLIYRGVQRKCYSF